MSKHSENHLITPEQAGTLSGLFFERVKRTPEALAYRHYDPSSEDVIDRMILRMLNEVVACLREKVVDEADYLDGGMVYVLV